ncbi:hypothetical protein [Phnomibacter ginsenosidimutans]|uniref:hypothetical protein n=1 Tax=Phnomibacter ginsenosidimutans TaxID=2676868 RepID=UPI0018D2609E|nr:hypothetical protein [Phnomibacter ginsenosidimutans]
MIQRYFFLIAIALTVLSCNTHDAPSVHRGFYYWKSRFALDSTESHALQQLRTEKLYIKLFDVAWDEQSQQPLPVAKMNFAEAFPTQQQYVPVVFITNETLQKSSPKDIDNLGRNIPKLISSITENNKLPMPAEIQLDCDWTAGTKDRYFLLLKQLRKSSFFQGKTLSVTIRLHQVKYTQEAGIPPADRGLLMCYNMGNLQQPATHNSIIDPATLNQYTGRLKEYSLPLDIALPIFNWWVWFEGNQYKGLIHSDALQLPLDAAKKWRCQSDTTINGYTFKQGDWLRYEDAPQESIEQVISQLQSQLKPDNRNIILYHLDAKSLQQYAIPTLESFYTRFHH